MKATVQSLNFSFNRIEVSLSGMNHTYFIQPEKIEWFSIKNDRSIQHTLCVGSVLEFDIECSKTRNLENVKFI